jgi:hypothetical protein
MPARAPCGLPEEFCSQVELVNGQVVRCEHPSWAHQAAASRIAAMLDAAAEAHMERNPGTCLDTGSNFDVLLWEVPAATIRSPDAALFDCAPNDVRPLPASLLKVVVEVVSPGSRKAAACRKGCTAMSDGMNDPVRYFRRQVRKERLAAGWTLAEFGQRIGYAG